MAGIHYWYPKVTGRMLSERLARWQFWLLYVGFLLCFGTMHISGMLGMPRRIYTYDADRGWTFLNQLTTLGAIIQVPSFAIFVYNLLWSLRKGRPAGDDPWDAWTLEWATSSPPASYNFADVPTVRSRRPLWDVKHPDDPDWQYEGGARDEGQGAKEESNDSASLARHPSPLSPAQWGMISFLASEVALFGTLIVTYLFYVGRSAVEPTPAEALSLKLVVWTTACLLASSATVHVAEKALEHGKRGGFIAWWLVTIVLGAVFLGGTAFEWHDLIHGHHLTISRNLFGTTYYTLVGLHALHVTGGVTIMLIVLGLTLRRQVTSANRTGVGLVAWYWHFVDVVWIVVFTAVYLVGR
jgi:heme/copper-type cytochrome/quinol oxidase subunit 3